MNENHKTYDVAIVGAGFAGLYLLHRCRKLGLSARIWEAGTGVGGTWYWNRYPGARCDIESVQYSYQFDDDLQQEWNWSERYSPQPEVLRYAEHVAARFNLLDDIDFEHRVSTATFDELTSTWTLATAAGKTMSAQFCVMATGCLSKPNWPSIDGYKDFQGPIHHTGLWPHEGVDLSGKRIALIGTGSSGIQSIPEIAAEAAHLTVFQRTPNYSIPARNKAIDPNYAADVKADYPNVRRRAKNSLNGFDGNYNTESALSVSASERLTEYERRWQYGGLTFMGAYGDLVVNKEANNSVVDFVHNKIRGIVNDPETAEKLCPDNIIGGKRLCVDSHYYETYNRDTVDLVDIKSEPIKEINRDGLQVGSTQYDVDIIVVATGFDAMTGALLDVDIRGKNNLSLSEQWKDGCSSYLGLGMAGFPNLFTVTGPGSPSVLTNMLPTIEHHVEWITDCISTMRENDHRAIEATEKAQEDWWQHVQEVGNRGLKQSTDSWYLGANVEGKPRVFMPYNGGFPVYCQYCAEVVAEGYKGFKLE